MIRHVRPRALALAALLVVAPLPFASVAPGPATWLLLATLAALALSLWTTDDNPGSGFSPPGGLGERLPRELILAAAALAAIALLGVLQSLPLPTAITRLLAPETIRLTRQAAELAGAPAAGSGAALARSLPLSLAPAASRSAALDWLLPAAGFLAAARLGSSRRVRRTLGGALLLAASAQVVIGVAQWISRSNTLWGVTLVDMGTRLRGSFVNPNHLALLLEIALAVAFAWVGWAVRRVVMGNAGGGGGAEDRLLTVGPPAILFLLLFGGLVLTGSRAALVSALVATSVQGMVIGSRRGRRWLLAFGLAVGLAGVVALAALGAEGAFTRLTASSVDELGSGYRVEAAGATLDLLRLFPLTGSGLGTFQAAFPLVQPPTIPGFWRHAHADWIEFLATTGVLGALLLGGGLFFYARQLRRVVLHGERSEDRAAGLAALGALVAVALHSGADFGLTMPANALALAIVAGAAGATQVVKRPPSSA